LIVGRAEWRSTLLRACGKGSLMSRQWDFVIAAYAVTALGTLALIVHSWLAMRRAERRAEALRNER